MGKPLKQAWIVDPAKIFSLYFLQSPGKVSQRSEDVRWRTRQNQRLPPFKVCLEPFGNSFMAGLKICDLCIKPGCRDTMRVSQSLLQKPFYGAASRIGCLGTNLWSLCQSLFPCCKQGTKWLSWYHPSPVTASLVHWWQTQSLPSLQMKIGTK